MERIISRMRTPRPTRPKLRAVCGIGSLVCLSVLIVSVFFGGSVALAHRWVAPGDGRDRPARLFEVAFSFRGGVAEVGWSWIDTTAMGLHGWGPPTPGWSVQTSWYRRAPLNRHDTGIDYYNSPLDWSWHGAGVRIDSGGRAQRVAISLLLLQVLLGIGLVWSHPRKFPLGSCSRCGYDLSASSQRCPECGATPAAESGSQARR